MKDNTDHPATAPTAIADENAMLLHGELSAALQKQIGLHAPIANEWARRITAYLSERLGAQHVYIPAPSRAERDAAIYRDHDGTNTAELMRRHGVSRTRLYEVLDEQRALARAHSPVSCSKTGHARA